MSLMVVLKFLWERGQAILNKFQLLDQRHGILRKRLCICVDSKRKQALDLSGVMWVGHNRKRPPKDLENLERTKQDR